MARSKHSRALFEVIKQSQELAAKRQQPRTSGGAGALLSWLRGRGRPPAKSSAPKPLNLPVMREVSPPPPPQNHVEVRRASRYNDPARIIEPAEPSGTGEIEVESAVERVFHDDSADTVSGRSSAGAQAVADVESASGEEAAGTEFAATGEEPAPGASGSAHDTAVAMPALAQDSAGVPAAEEAPVHAGGRRRSRQDGQVHLVLSYPSIGVATIALMLLMIVSFLAGRQTARPIARTGPTLAQLQNSQPSPDVLSLGATPGTTTVTQSSEPVADRKSAARTTTPPVANDSIPAAPAPDRRRVIGRNYIIAQSYPDPDHAAKAADLLNRNNIPVTVEQIDAAPGWYCVVTEVGFDRVSTSECERYQKLIRDVNAQARAARLKAFEPYLYKWK
ncbi:MAG: hypothetical protein NZ561_06675 [Phycisphaerae bacterium]|nr:hypothetical protein [Phycisphaerae bacterium]MDW8262713.1 hypothetical protein [Phycisphaerales bacterium]